MAKKRIISAVLAVIILLAACVPRPLEVSAAKNKVSYIVFDLQGGSKYKSVESGKKFHFGNLVLVSMEEGYADDYWCASELKAKYVSDNPAVLSVDKDGNARAKAPGYATVIVTYQGETEKCSVKVVEEGTLYPELSRKNIKKWDAAGKKLSQKIPPSLNEKNGYTMAKALKTYVNSVSKYDKKGRIDLYGEIGDHLAVPSASCFRRAQCIMNRWENRNHPCRYSNMGNRAGASGTADGITVKLKKKVTDKGLLAVYFREILDDTLREPVALNPTLNMKIDNKRFAVYAYLEDTKGEHNYRAVAVFEKGSRTVAIKPTAVIKEVDGSWQRIEGDDLKIEPGTYLISCKNLFEEEVTVM